MKLPTTIILLFAFGFVLSTQGRAEDCDSQQRESAFQIFPDKYTAVQQLYNTGCYGSLGDSTQWVAAIRQQKPDIRPNTTREDELWQRKQWSLSVIDAVLAQTGGISLRPSVREEFMAALHAAREQLEIDAPIEGVTRPIAWRLKGGSGGMLSIPSLSLKQTVQQHCDNSPGLPPPDTACEHAIDYAEQVLRMANLVESAMLFHDQPVIRAFAERYTLRDRMWDAYLDEAHPQFPWEWALNSWRMDRNDHRPRDLDDQPMGPMAIPNDQIILLHPAVGIERLDVERADATTDPTIYVEFIGYNRWTWNPATGEMRNGLGVSLIGSLASRDQTDDFSYGLMFHFRNKYSIAVTKTDDSTGILFGVDLADLFREKLNSARSDKKFW